MASAFLPRMLKRSPAYGLGAFSLLISSTSLLLLFCGCVVCDSPKTVSMNLSARWGETSLLLETAEFLAQESRDKFWQFVDRVVESSTSEEDVADAFPVAIDSKHYEKMLVIASSLITPLQLRYLKFALALRWENACEIFRHVALKFWCKTLMQRTVGLLSGI